MVTGRQIRAARGLLGWSTADLATRCGIARESINKIEDGSVSPREGTINDITKAFVQERIEFLDNEGVRFFPEGIEVLNGEKGMQKFWDSVYAFAQVSGGIIRQNGIKEASLNDCAPKVAASHMERMAQLVSTRKDIFVRAILEEGDNNFLCTDYADYRWNSKEAPPPVPCYIFGDSVALFTFEALPSPKIVLISSPVIALAYTKQFNRSWELAQPPISRKKRA